MCYIILTHKITEGLLKYIEQLKQEINIPIHIVIPNWDSIFNKYNTFKLGNDYTGNSIFPIIEFSKMYNYDRYIVSEWDTRFTGNHQNLIDNIPNCDLLLQELFSLCTDWFWNKFSNIPNDVHRVHNLLNWYVISKKALEHIEACYNLGWYGHYECIVPTAVYNNSDLKIDYINKLYPVLMDWLVGTFKNILFNYVCNNTSLNNCFLHPIKT